ncbi:hypothetical protein Bbelb_405000 [Branchiostoma belcheri]|nr:hypothetical protein Bbelb_405000 [Branchiostoma belcheri]
MASHTLPWRPPVRREVTICTKDAAAMRGRSSTLRTDQIRPLLTDILFTPRRAVRTALTSPGTSEDNICCLKTGETFGAKATQVKITHTTQCFSDSLLTPGNTTSPQMKAVTPDELCTAETLEDVQTLMACLCLGDCNMLA